MLPATTLRRILAVYLAAIFLVTAVYATQNARTLHPWILAEWLIPYTTGPIRRGIIGQLLLITRLPLVPAALTLQLLTYATFFLAIFRLTANIRWSWPLLAALVSPATLAFTVLDPPSSVRKEALLYATLALTLLLQRHRPKLALILLTLAAPFLVLTHEALLAYLPYLFAAPLLLQPRPTLAKLLPATTLTALATLFVLQNPGTPTQAAAICTTFSAQLHRPMSIGNPQTLCGGAIAYLAHTPADARADTRRAAAVYNYRTRYPIPAILALAPAALLLWRRRRQPGARIILLATALAFALSAPLFFIARDWGRWISLHATCLLLLLLALKHLPAHQSRQPLSGLPLPPTPGRRVAAFALLILYATAWTLPAVGIFPGRFGYPDLIRYVARYSTRNARSHPPGTF